MMRAPESLKVSLVLSTKSNSISSPNWVVHNETAGDDCSGKLSRRTKEFGRSESYNLSDAELTVPKRCRCNPVTKQPEITALTFLERAFLAFSV